jgi:hypothetical protein
MRIAYLITAYHQPGHLHRLVAALDEAEVDFYVHVDRRVDLAPFAQGLAGKPNVHFADRRLDVQWMGFSQVESILGLMRQAAARGFDYCVLLSGSDYPIKSRRSLRSFYEGAQQEYITFWKLGDRPSWQHKIEYYYPIDRIPIRGYSKNLEPVYWRRLFWGRFHQYRPWMPRRKFPFDMVPYGGSDWWSLSAGCVRHVLRFIEDNPAFSRFYRYTHCPSEMFFHTIIMNSEWAARTRMFERYRAWSARASAQEKALESSMLPEHEFNLRYIDWSGEKTGAREAPAVLDERDWPGIRASDDLFARKFEMPQSARLLDRIDHEIMEAQAA